MSLRLKYETGIAATVQFIVMTIINFVNGVSGSVSQCLNGSSGCVGNIVLAALFFLAVTVWFGALWLAGFAAQDRRSRRIAEVLIVAEALVLLIGLYGLMHMSSIIGGVKSLAEVATSVWISWLAFRLIRAKGGRVRARSRRHHPSQPTL